MQKEFYRPDKAMEVWNNAAKVDPKDGNGLLNPGSNMGNNMGNTMGNNMGNTKKQKQKQRFVKGALGCFWGRG